MACSLQTRSSSARGAGGVAAPGRRRGCCCSSRAGSRRRFSSRSPVRFAVLRRPVQPAGVADRRELFVRPCGHSGDVVRPCRPVLLDSLAHRARRGADRRGPRDCHRDRLAAGVRMVRVTSRAARTAPYRGHEPGRRGPRSRAARHAGADRRGVGGLCGRRPGAGRPAGVQPRCDRYRRGHSGGRARPRRRPRRRQPVGCSGQPADGQTPSR